MSKTYNNNNDNERICDDRSGEDGDRDSDGDNDDEVRSNIIVTTARVTTIVIYMVLIKWL